MLYIDYPAKQKPNASEIVCTVSEYSKTIDMQEIMEMGHLIAVIECKEGLFVVSRKNFTEKEPSGVQFVKFK